MEKIFEFAKEKYNQNHIAPHHQMMKLWSRLWLSLKKSNVFFIHCAFDLQCVCLVVPVMCVFRLSTTLTFAVEPTRRY